MGDAFWPLLARLVQHVPAVQVHEHGTLRRERPGDAVRPGGGRQVLLQHAQWRGKRSDFLRRQVLRWGWTQLGEPNWGDPIRERGGFGGGGGESLRALEGISSNLIRRVLV